MKLHRFERSVFDGGAARYEAGKHYRPDDETARQVALGNAVEVEVKVDLAHAEKLARKATEAAAKAEESARLARADADAAAEAKRLLEEAEAAIAAGQEASADAIQRAQQKLQDLEAHAAGLAEQAGAAQREHEAAAARAAGAPDNVQLAELAAAAKEHAESLERQAEQAALATEAFRAEIESGSTT